MAGNNATTPQSTPAATRPLEFTSRLTTSSTDIPPPISTLEMPWPGTVTSSTTPAAFSGGRPFEFTSRLTTSSRIDPMFLNFESDGGSGSSQATFAETTPTTGVPFVGGGPIITSTPYAEALFASASQTLVPYQPYAPQPAPLQYLPSQGAQQMLQQMGYGMLPETAQSSYYASQLPYQLPPQYAVPAYSVLSAPQLPYQLPPQYATPAFSLSSVAQAPPVYTIAQTPPVFQTAQEPQLSSAAISAQVPPLLNAAQAPPAFSFAQAPPVLNAAQAPPAFNFAQAPPVLNAAQMPPAFNYLQAPPVHPYAQAAPAQPQSSVQAQAQAQLATLLMQAAPPSLAQSFSQPSVVQSMLTNLFATMTGDKVKKPYEISATTGKFAMHIANHPLPATTLPLTLGTYDGAGDPEDFLQRFEGAMKTQHWADPVACHIFPTVLQGVAREWFSKLPPLSITSYADLRTRFLQQYHNLRAHARTHLEAHDLKQKPKESLGEFITRYTNECQKIPNLPPSQQISGFIFGICHDRHGSLVRRLRRKLPGTFSEAVEIARDYMRAGDDGDMSRVYGKDNKDRDDDDSRHDHGRGPNFNRKHDSGPGPMRKDKSRYRPNHGQRDNRHNDHNGHKRYNDDNNNVLLGLSKTPREILATEKVRSSFDPPSAAAAKYTKDKNAYCDFHEEKGHSTNSCIQLKEQIKVALRAGKLDHLLPHRKAKKDDNAKTFGWQKKDPQDKSNTNTPELTIS